MESAAKVEKAFRGEPWCIFIPPSHALIGGVLTTMVGCLFESFLESVETGTNAGAIPIPNPRHTESSRVRGCKASPSEKYDDDRPGVGAAGAKFDKKKRVLRTNGTLGTARPTENPSTSCSHSSEGIKLRESVSRPRDRNRCFPVFIHPFGSSSLSCLSFTFTPTHQERFGNGVLASPPRPLSLILPMILHGTCTQGFAWCFG